MYCLKQFKQIYQYMESHFHIFHCKLDSAIIQQPFKKHKEDSNHSISALTVVGMEIIQPSWKLFVLTEWKWLSFSSSWFRMAIRNCQSILILVVIWVDRELLFLMKNRSPFYSEETLLECMQACCFDLSSGICKFILWLRLYEFWCQRGLILMQKHNE